MAMHGAQHIAYRSVPAIYDNTVHGACGQFGNMGIQTGTVSRIDETASQQCPGRLGIVLVSPIFRRLRGL
ncbi:hypothetical protein RAA17_10200 [Komagataeibacter rhaeticus]|nr:hypothetical protein [Komagataeibacter rhaeticus]